MLSPADRQLVARERHLPGLATVLDGERLAERVRAPLGDDSLELRPRYVRYKPATSCLVAFDVRAAAGPGVAYAGAFSRGAEAKVEKLAHQRGDGGGRRAVALPDENVALRFVPDDLRLPGLGRLRDAERMAFLEQLLPGSPHLWAATPALLRYKPERRAVVQLDVDGRPAAVLKCHAAAAFDTARAATRVLERRPSVRTPAVLGRSRRYRTLVYPWVAGRTVDSASDDPRALGAVGAALAELHRLPTRSLSPRVSGEVRSELDAAVRSLRALDDGLGACARDIAAAIVASWERDPVDPLAFLHGDATPDQFVIDDEGIVVLDLDRAAAGDHHRDLGQLLAALPDDGRPNAVAGYLSAGGRVDLPRLRAATAAALLHRAVEPFRHRAEDWLDGAARILEAARLEVA